MRFETAPGQQLQIDRIEYKRDRLSAFVAKLGTPGQRDGRQRSVVAQLSQELGEAEVLRGGALLDRLDVQFDGEAGRLTGKPHTNYRRRPTDASMRSTDIHAMRTLITPLMLLALMTTTASAQMNSIYRCDGGKHTMYSDRPCSDAAVLIDGTPRSHGVEFASIDARKAIPEAPAGYGSPAGLSSREVLARYGRPWDSQVQWRNRVLTETWTWRNVGGEPLRLTFRNDRVVER